jgi:osmotically-inducible protein OsmY
MKLFKVFYFSVAATMLVGGVSGCVTPNQPEDARINKDVQVMLDQQASLSAPSIINVQTIQSTVYLRGLVSTDLERRSAEEVAYEVPGVVRVVNTIGLEN